MIPFQQRIAELWRKQKHQPLTDEENTEFVMCLNLNEGYAHQMAKLEELSFQAHVTNDYEWLHQICADIEKLQDQYQTNAIKHLPNNK